MINPRKAKAILIFFMVVMALVSGCVGGSDAITKLKQQFSEFDMQYKDKQSQGYNITEAKDLAYQAKQSYYRSDNAKAKELLDRAFESLGKAKKMQIPEAAVTGNTPAERSNESINKDDARKRLSSIKIASQYRYVTDGMNGRKLDDVIKILKDTRTEFIFQGLNRQNSLPETCSDLPGTEQNLCETSGYSYDNFKTAISQIKQEMPEVIFGGGFLAEFLDPNSRNEITGKTYSKDELWGMAADPGKWEIPKSKNEFQTDLAIRFGWTKTGEPYDPKEQMHYYFPDITNPAVKEIFLSWAKKQIDIGVDSLWIDGLYSQAELFRDLTGDINHRAVKESYEASSDLIDEIHKYGLSKGKYVYVISWARPMMLEAPYASPDLDGVMVTIGNSEINELKMNENKWDNYKEKTKNVFGDVPIFARIDYGNVESPLAVFSEEPKDRADQFLSIADDFFQQKGIIFIYPIHGGNMGNIGQQGKILSYGQYDWYDSLAPEFQTYDQIKELANKKYNTK